MSSAELLLLSGLPLGAVREHPDFPTSEGWRYGTPPGMQPRTTTTTQTRTVAPPPVPEVAPAPLAPARPTRARAVRDPYAHIRAQMLMSERVPASIKRKMLITPAQLQEIKRRTAAHRKAVAAKSKPAYQARLKTLPTYQRVTKQKAERQASDRLRSSTYAARMFGGRNNFFRAIEALYGKMSDIPGWSGYLVGNVTTNQIVSRIHSDYTAHMQRVRAERATRVQARDVAAEAKYQRIQERRRVPAQRAPITRQRRPAKPRAPEVPIEARDYAYYYQKAIEQLKGRRLQPGTERRTISRMARAAQSRDRTILRGREAQAREAAALQVAARDEEPPPFSTSAAPAFGVREAPADFQIAPPVFRPPGQVPPAFRFPGM